MIPDKSRVRDALQINMSFRREAQLQATLGVMPSVDSDSHLPLERLRSQERTLEDFETFVCVDRDRDNVPVDWLELHELCSR